MRSGSASLMLLSALWLLPASSSAEATQPTATQPAATRAYEANIMATRIAVQFAGATGGEADAEAVFAVFRAIDALASEWKPGSPLAELNRRAGGAVPVPKELTALLRRSIELAVATDGAFDPTWAALWGLWDFKAEQPTVPGGPDIAARVALVDWRKLELSDGAARLGSAGMLVGLGGIAKGWALDGAAALLRERGVTDWVLSAGGQILSDGHNAAGTAWTVGVRDPRGTADDFFAVLTASGLSVSTSGDYERYFIRDGVRYHHILDPRTGRPARGLRSVTVLSPDATTADALSTALMVMGYERGSALVSRLDGVEAVWVDEAGGVVMSRGLGDRLKLVHPPRPE